jgi:two-component system chemotaxis sensor kinase CheA
MTGDLDPVDAFRQEAAELLDTLETTLLDLGQRPQDRGLVDTAFRALHTIKGAGSMFGFDQVASFTHDFETAFDLVRKGKAEPSDDLVTVALAAKDYIRTLIEDPDSTDPIIGAAVLEDLKRIIDTGHRASAPAQTASLPAAPTQAGWSIGIALDPDVLRNGANPLNLLDDLRQLGTCTVTPIADDVPELPALDPQELYLKWHVELISDCGLDAIEEVFMFVRGDMELTLMPLESTGGPKETEAPANAHPPVQNMAPQTAAPAALAQMSRRPHPPTGISKKPTRKANPPSEPTTGQPRRFAFRPSGLTSSWTGSASW